MGKFPANGIKMGLVRLTSVWIKRGHFAYAKPCGKAMDKSRKLDIDHSFSTLDHPLTTLRQGEFMRKSLTKNSTTTDTNRVIFSSRNHIKTTQEIVLFFPVFCPTIGGRFMDLSPKSTVEKTLIKLLNNKYAQLTICTQSALKQLSEGSIKTVKPDYVLIYDEFSHVDHFYSVAMTHTHQHYSHHLTATPYGSADLLKVTLAQNTTLPLELADPKKYRDDTQKLFAPVLDHLLSGDTVLTAKEAYTNQIIKGRTNVNRKDPAVHFLVIEKPDYLLGWKKTTILSANFDQSLTFHLLRQFYGIQFVMDQGIQKSLRFTQHTNGHRLTIKYLDTGSTSITRYGEIAGSGKENNFIRIDDFTHSQFSNGYLIVANNKHTLQRHSNREELPVISHGLNAFQHTHQVAFLAALNKSTMHIKMLKSLGIKDELIGAHIHETIYQAVMRCSLRDPSAVEPVTVFLTDKPRAEALSRKLNGSKLVALQLMGYTDGSPLSNKAVVSRKRFRKHQKMLASPLNIQGGGTFVPQISIRKKNEVQKFPTHTYRQDTLEERGNYPLSAFEYLDRESEHFLQESMPYGALEQMQCTIEEWLQTLFEPDWVHKYRKLGTLSPEFIVSESGCKPFDDHADAAFMVRVWISKKVQGSYSSCIKSTDSYGDTSGYEDLLFKDAWEFQKYLNKCSKLPVKDKFSDELSAAIQACIHEPYFDGHSRKKYDPYVLDAECVTRKYHSVMMDFDDTLILPNDLSSVLVDISHSIMSSYSNQVGSKGWRYRLVIYLPYVVSYVRYISLYNHIAKVIQDAGYTPKEIALDQSKSAEKSPEALFLLPCTNNDYPQNHICINSWDHYAKNKKKELFFKELLEPASFTDAQITVKPKVVNHSTSTSAATIPPAGNWNHSAIGDDRGALITDKIKDMRSRERGTGNGLFFKIAMSLSNSMGPADLADALQKIAESDVNPSERISEIPHVIKSVAKYRSQDEAEVAEVA